MECTEPDCERDAAVLLCIPWEEDREVCTAHARGMSTQDGVVARPLPGKEEEWP